MYKNTLLVLFLMIFRTFAQQVWVPFLQESKAPPSVTLQQSNSNAVSFSLQVKGMSVTQKNISKNSYNRLFIPDGEHLKEKGSPELPVISKLIAIPDCDDVILSIIPSGRREFSNYNVSPVPTYQKKQLPDGGTNQTIILKEDNSIYTCDAEFPGKYGEIIETGYVREQKVARIAIFPVQFNPAQRSLTAFTDFQIDISFVNPSSPVNKELGIFRNMMHHTALNYELDGISASSKIDDNMPGNTLGKVATGSVTRVTNLDLLMDADPMPADYLMISDSSLFNNESLTTLANHRRDYNGYDVAIVQVDASGADNDIYDDYGTPHDEAIRDFIMDVYNDGTANHTGDGQLGYVLFVGDAWQDDHSTEMVPAATPSYYNSTYEYGGDYYYACTGGDSDSLLDLMYGRLSVGNATELGNVVDKIKEYELNSSSIWNDEVTFVGGSYDLFYYSDPDIETMTELLPPPNTKKHYAYMAETGDATSVTEANPIYGQLFTTAQYDDANENCGATNLDDWLYDNSDAGINNDIHTIVYEGHGRRGGLRGNEGLGRLILCVDEVATNLDNNLYPFMIFNCCQTGWFDSQTADLGSVDCIAEVVVNLEDKGAIGCLASTRDSDTGAFGAVDRYILGAQFNHMSHFMGEAVMESKLLLSNKYRRQYNLYGDPATNLFPDGFTITESITLSGTHDINSDITVSSGVILTISSGSNLRFTNGKKLIVNGTLQADGATFTATTKGDWYGIVFNSTATSLSYLDSCTIENAYTGIKINGSDPTIDDCEISDCDNIGILVTGSTAQPEIRNSYLYDIDYDALYVTGDADPKVFNNKLYAGQGFAVRVYGADGLFCGNEFRTQTTHSGVGIYGSTSSPEFNEDYFQGNLWDMRYIAGSNAVYISAGQPDFGDYPIHRGANDFMYLSYIGDDDYYIHNNSGNMVLAESNYWGVTQPADSFFTGNVDRDPYASSSQGAGPSWKPLVDLYQQAIAAYDQRQYEQAIALFDEILKDYRHERLDRCAFLLLKAAQKSDKLNDYLPLVNSVAQVNPQSSLDHIHRMWQSYAYAQKGDLEAAESVILSAPEYSRSEREGLLSLIGYAVSHGELNRAEEIATRLNSRYPDDSYLARDISVMLNSPPLVFDDQNNKRPSLGTETKGLQAWPTPFNASTTIQYTVQEAGYTELYVVNMLGQRIRTLVQNRVQSGKHRMSWDGKDARGNPVASGVYLIVCKTLEKSTTAKILYLK